MYDDAIAYLQVYKRDHLFLPKANWPDFYMNERLAERWAVNELMYRIRKEKNENHHLLPCEIIYIFITDMDKAISQYEDAKIISIFTTARDLADELFYCFV